MEQELKIGDKVMTTQPARTGIIVELHSGHALVEYDGWTDGHGNDRNRWWSNKSDCTLAGAAPGFKKGDWVRATNQRMVDHWNNCWAERAGYVAKVGSPFKIASANPNTMSAHGGYYEVAAGSISSGPFWYGNQIEPWTPRVGDRVRFVKDNPNCGAAFGAEGDRATVNLVHSGSFGGYGQQVRVDVDGGARMSNVPISALDPLPVAEQPAAGPTTAPAKFKKGDKVRYVGEDDSEFYTKGKVYEITSGDDGYYYSLTDNHAFGPHSWSIDALVRQFELITEPAPLQIQAGRYYKTRDGRKVGPAKRDTSGNFGKEWKWDFGFGSPLADDGQYGYFGEPSPEDIIAEWPAEAEVPAVAPAKFKVGDRVVLQGSGYSFDGATGTITEVDEDDNDFYRAAFDHDDARMQSDWGVLPDDLRLADEAETKFKVGDPIRHKELGHVGTVKEIASADRVKTHWTKLGWGGIDPIEDIELITAPTTAIVMLIDNGTPKPSATPKVHATKDAAIKEAKRLAGIYRGKEYGVFVLADTCKMEPKEYDHEWQRLAAEGEKTRAIVTFRTITGLGIKESKDAVDHWLAAA